MEGQLKYVTLTADCTYQALSYVWRDKEDLPIIKVNKKPFYIMKNLECALRHLRYSAVFWANSKDVDTLEQGNLDEAAETVNRWLSSTENDRWLVIYDNYDTPKLPEHDGPGTFDMGPYFLEADLGAVLITTWSFCRGKEAAGHEAQPRDTLLTQTPKRDWLSLGT
jgi:hypothetical protein